MKTNVNLFQCERAPEGYTLLKLKITVSGRKHC